MISLDNLTVSYGGWTLFDNISFLINPKDRIGLVGKNGAGKTTLLRIITGEQQPTSGAVTINGECTIGYLPQTMRVADTTTLVEETAKAFDEVLRLEAEIEYEKYKLHHKARLSVKPGITGLWQVSGRSEITDFEEVVKLDTEYICHWSMANDIKILLRTVQVVISGKGSM